MQRSWSVPVLVIAIVVTLALRLVSASHRFETRTVDASELYLRGMTAMFVMPRNYTKQFNRVTLERYYVEDAEANPVEVSQHNVPDELILDIAPLEAQYILVKFKPDIMTMGVKPLSHVNIRFPVNHRAQPGGGFNTFTTQ